MSEMLQCKGLTKVFEQGGESICVLDGIDLTVQAGERIAIIGPSGSGKSTLLHILGGLEQPSAGKVSLLGEQWRQLSEKKRCQLRNQHLGFVYQFHHLLPEFTAFENIAMPLLLAQHPPDDIESRVHVLLEAVGLLARQHHKPAQLSGGERQRVAIARALIHAPSCVLADEPTGNLDRHTAEHVFDLMLGLKQRFKSALVIVTHDLALAKQMDRCLTLSGGKLVEVA
ncbi:MAG: ATP-binding cassette domain-containing protein [Gammaproteobacteria bacterium]|nr:ATP-binding cassette domain-containing protein [Gammaproteobacteria bacterium]